jgi:N6-L-threonylcarbamoyladenine synthase
LDGGGGVAVERAAAQAAHADSSNSAHEIRLPIPMQAKKNMNFSFAGLKNAFRMQVDNLRSSRELDSEDPLGDETVAILANAFQEAAITHVEERLSRAMTFCEERGVRSLALVGGVAANQELRRKVNKLCEEREEPWQLVVPPPRLCTDNGVMVAWNGIERLRSNISNVAQGQEVFPRIPLGASIEFQQ